jgi:GNAT superfamily N-acetyltransferase
MPSYACDFCEQTITASDDESLIELVGEHFEAAHGEYGITMTAVRNYFAALGRLTGPTERLAEIGAVETVPVSTARIEDLLGFFDHDAFAGMPEWASCYCMFHHLPHEVWGERTWQENRADLADRLESGATTGVIAYAGGKVVGWCNASLREELPARADGSDADGTVLVTCCFQVAPPYRGHGVARRLLDAAIDLARGRGCTAVEGFPNPKPDTTNPEAFPGPPALYRSAGFDVEGNHAWLGV